ncbi:MAG: hypothetical protein NTW55_07820 [Planctomycetota bacterium]|nr:hypothetical protein [Planctomycetota bacterium]
MNEKLRRKRLRLLVIKINKERKRQGLKIDVLCKDLIGAQKEFIKQLDTISFAATFYESIIGITDTGGLFYMTSRFIREKIPNANVVFILRQADSFELHLFESDQPITLNKQQLENCFTPEIVDNICKSNRICTLDDMFAMGLQGNLTVLNKIAAAAIPLGSFAATLGFILIYRSAQNKFADSELNNITAITQGISRAIQSCQIFSHANDLK